MNSNPLSPYNILSKSPDYFTLQHKSTLQKAFFKQFLSSPLTQTQLLLLLDEINKRKSLLAPSLLTLLSFSFEESPKSPKKLKFSIIYEYFIQDFQVEIQPKLNTSGFWSQEELLNTFESVLHGLWTLHSNGLVHGDVQSRNIVVNENGFVKLADQFVSSNFFKRELVYGEGGPWVAPEGIGGEGAQMTPENDLWALGVVFLEAASLTEVEPIYQGGRINKKEIQQRFQKIDKIYDSHWLKVLKSLLSFEVEERREVYKMFGFEVERVMDIDLVPMKDDAPVSPPKPDKTSSKTESLESLSNPALLSHKETQIQADYVSYLKKEILKRQSSLARLTDLLTESRNSPPPSSSSLPLPPSFPSSQHPCPSSLPPSSSFPPSSSSPPLISSHPPSSSFPPSSSLPHPPSSTAAPLPSSSRPASSSNHVIPSSSSSSRFGVSNSNGRSSSRGGCNKENNEKQSSLALIQNKYVKLLDERNDVKSLLNPSSSSLQANISNLKNRLDQCLSQTPPPKSRPIIPSPQKSIIFDPNNTLLFSEVCSEDLPALKENHQNYIDGVATLKPSHERKQSLQPPPSSILLPPSSSYRPPPSSPFHPPPSSPFRPSSSSPFSQPSSFHYPPSSLSLLPPPYSQPSLQPSSQPSSQASIQPSSQPSCQTSSQPSSQPSYQPSLLSPPPGRTLKKLIYENGDYYEGETVNTVREGFGRLYSKVGKVIYQGEWKDDEFHGHGIKFNCSGGSNSLKENNIYQDFSKVNNFWVKYEGGFVKGKKHGNGVLVLGNNEFFQGSFKNDKVEGKGSYQMNNGKRIIAEWVANKLMNRIN